MKNSGSNDCAQMAFTAAILAMKKFCHVISVELERANSKIMKNVVKVKRIHNSLS